MRASLITDRTAAEGFFDERIGAGVKPGQERVAGVLAAMGDPHREYPVIHVAGTNGKTTSARMIADILGAHGLKVGTFTSPHLQRVEERFSVAGRPFTEAQFVAAVADVAPFVEWYEEQAGESITYFEATVITALAAFADLAVDVAVVEVGLGGRLDATRVVNAAVSVITSIGLDHMDYLGDTLAAIAAEKVAIVEPGGTLVTGPLPAAAEGAVTARIGETGARWLRHGTDFQIRDARLAVGGWSVGVEGVYDTYEDVYLPLHGRHQVTNLATSIAAGEALFGRGLDPAAVEAAAAEMRSPGRLEIVRRGPLVLLDGAHNAAGMEALATALTEEFPDEPWIAVVGMRGSRNPAELLAPLRGRVRTVVATQPSDAAAIPATEIAAGARAALGDEVEIEAHPAVVDAVDRAIALAGEGGSVVVTGSLYVVGEARTGLVGDVAPAASSVHARIEAPPLLGADDDEDTVDLRDELDDEDAWLEAGWDDADG